ncbi:MAG: type II toxin-antitoxin system RelB family antitoxin [Gammaproteobacteria bacterium]
MKTFTIDQARSAAASGGVLSANLRPVGSMFALEFETRNGPAMLIAAVSKKVRRFGNPTKAFEIVRDLGLEGGRYSVAQWRPDEREIDRPTRPDKSATLKATHESAAYDKWFRAQVQEALDDPRPGIPHEQVMAETRALIDRIAAEKKTSNAG